MLLSVSLRDSNHPDLDDGVLGSFPLRARPTIARVVPFAAAAALATAAATFDVAALITAVVTAGIAAARKGTTVVAA